MRHRDADGGVVRAIGHGEIVGPRAAGHVGDADRRCPARAARSLADHVEIGDAVDLVVVGNPVSQLQKPIFGRT